MGTIPGHPSRRLAAGGLGILLLLLVLSMPVYTQSDVIVNLESPQPGAQVQGNVELVGTVRGTGLQRYELHYRPTGNGQGYIYFDGDQIQIEAGVLGRWSTEGLAPGDYEIRLQAVLDNQQVVQATVVVTLVPEGEAVPAADEEEPAPVAPDPASPQDTALRQAVDDLVLRAHPAALGAYLWRGMRWSGTIAMAVLVYLGLKALLLYVIRRLWQR